MGINIRQKGQNGEREFANEILKPIILEVMTELGCAEAEIVKAVEAVQRNQNQSAVGGCDLVGTFGLAIEVKRQEALSVNSWWDQCVESAKRLGHLPVLVYRQNRRAWNVRTLVWLPTVSGSTDYISAPATFDLDTFKTWFRSIIRATVKVNTVKTAASS